LENYQRFDDYDIRRPAKRAWGEVLERFLRSNGAPKPTQWTALRFVSALFIAATPPNVFFPLWDISCACTRTSGWRAGVPLKKGVFACATYVPSSPYATTTSPVPFSPALPRSAGGRRLLKTNSDGAASVLIPAGRSNVQRMHPWPDFFSSHLLKFYPSFVSFYVLCADSSLDMLSWCAVPRRD
jgi:hypothetical protein